MTLQPLWDAGPIVAAHALAAVAAMALGAAQLTLAKGGARHRALGYAWVSVMGFVALSSFWIHDFRLIGPFSPIHLLSAVTLVALVQAVRAARAGRITAHKRAMATLFGLALVLTGLFTLLPGRAMHAVLLGG